MPMSREQYTNFYGSTMLPAITKACFDEFAKRAEQYSQVIKVVPTTKSLDQYTEVAGTGLARYIPEGGNIGYDEMRPGTPKNFLPLKYGLAIQTTLEMAEDAGKWPIIGNMSKQLGRSIAETRELQIAQIYNNGFDTGYIQYNGKPAFSTTHPLLRGGTWSNRLPAMTLSMGSLEAAKILMRRTPNLTGFPALLRPSKLIVPVRNEYLGLRLLRSTDDPETANRSINPIQKGEGGSMDLFVYQYLQDPGPVEFMLFDMSSLNVVAYERDKPYMNSDTDWENETTKTGMRYRWSYGVQNARGILGVPAVGSGF